MISTTAALDEQVTERKSFLFRLSAIVRYLYFLRFSIFLLVAVPALAFVDHDSPILHAIFTPQFVGQFIACGFFTICTGCISLVLARVACLNGGSRFESAANPCVPPFFEEWLGDKSEKRVLWVLLIWQLPGLLLLGKLHSNASNEEVTYAKSHIDLLAMFGGILLALFFWYFVSAIYYWSFPFTIFKRSARTLLFPRRFFWLGAYKKVSATNEAGQIVLSDNIEERGTLISPKLSIPLDWIFNIVARIGPGYSDPNDRGQLWEAHRFSIIGFIGYLGIYVFLFPITAPVTQYTGNRLAFIGATIAFGILAFFMGYPPRQPTVPPTFVLAPGRCVTESFRWFTTIFFSVACIESAIRIFIPSPTHYIFISVFQPPLQFFPVLASVEVLITALALLLAAAAFYLDRFPLPVFTAVVLAVALLHTFFPNDGEHFYPAFERAESHDLPTPAELLNDRCKESAPCDLIIVTSTGGGMHAAVWSSSVLVALEEAFDDHHDDITTANNRIKRFHESLFLASAVSGGSVGLAPFLREYKTPNPFPIPSSTDLSTYRSRIRRATSCSSLEAVAWGLEYSDFLHVLFPWLRPSPTHDRSMALEMASARNYTEIKCDPNETKDPKLPGVQDGDNPSEFTLATSQPTAGFPAFAMNTTAAETGGRFLLANYRNEATIQNGVVPAESFLHAYNADINMVTAARLSATFPYISSAARIRPQFSPGALHFVDGGYFDNDGTATVIEFLASAFAGRTPFEKKDIEKRVRILIIEIRDGFDLDGNNSPESNCKQQQYCKLWDTENQLDAPLIAFYRTGHVSVTRRNRRELFLLEDALAKKADICHVVFPFNENTPLSWQLTPRQISEIDGEFKKPAFLDPLNEVLQWAQRTPHLPCSRSPANTP